jgi:hypothetical protein
LCSRAAHSNTCRPLCHLSKPLLCHAWPLRSHGIFAVPRDPTTLTVSPGFSFIGLSTLSLCTGRIHWLRPSQRPQESTCAESECSCRVLRALRAIACNSPGIRANRRLRHLPVLISESFRSI